MRIALEVDHKLRTPWNPLPEPVKTAVLDALTIPNQAKIQAQKAKRFDARDMPDVIPLYRFEHGQLVMPRGFWRNFASGLRELGHVVEVADNRTFEQLFRAGEIITPQPHQVPARAALLEHEQGIYKAPAGSGKTVTVLAAIRKIGARSLVIVNTKDILWQWQERALNFLGPHYPVGQIGDNKFDVSPYLTIATAQTLNSRFDQLEADGFFELFSIVNLDECHWATAETINRVMDRFTARYRWGVSATPDKTGDFELAKAVLGPIIHTTKPEDVPTLMRPEVIRITSKFGYGYQSGEGRWKRSNYPQMLDALINNPARNDLIATAVMRYGIGHHMLLVSKRLEHLRIIRALVESKGYPHPIVTITGDDSSDDRQAAKALAEHEPCLVLSTLADEAMDIPRLDRIVLPFPQANTGLVTQQVGRVERQHEGKVDAYVIDIADLNVGPLERQWVKRRTEVYMQRGYRISTVKANELLTTAA